MSEERMHYPAGKTAELLRHSPAELEGLAAEYASAVESRRRLTDALRTRMLAAAAAILPALREATAAERDCRAALAAAVEMTPALFIKPRTRTAHGVKYGWQTGKARIEIADEARTIKLIRKHVEPAQQELLIHTQERVSKPAVLDLEARWLRLLGIVQHGGEERVVVKPIQDAADALVGALLADAEVSHVDG